MTPCPQWQKVKDLPESCFHGEATRRLKVDFIIDSSKELCWLIDSQEWARKSDLDATNFLLWKEPEEMAYSQWKRGRDLTSWMPSYMAYYRRLLALNVPFYSVSSRDLSSEPAPVVKRICDITGLTWFEGKEQFWNRQHHHLFGSMGTRRQAEAPDGRIRAEKGYVSEFLEVLPAVRAALACHDGLTGLLEKLALRDIMAATTNGEPPFERPLMMPLWYYAQRAKRAIRRGFPQKAHLDQ